MQALEAALKDAPDNPLAHYSLAVSLMQLGNTERAETELQSALKSRPTMVQAQKLLAQIALRKGDFTLARQSAEAIMKIEPRSAEGYLLRADALLRAETGRAQILHCSKPSNGTRRRSCVRESRQHARR